MGWRGHSASGMGTSCGCEELPEGCEDVPGYAHLPEFSPLLYVGNQYSASAGDFDFVVSTVVPLDTDGNPTPDLSSVALLFEDGHGSESSDEAALARESIMQGATVVARALAARKKTLVHCAWGQNRSGSICCAYAVLYCGWSAKAAIAYFRQRNFAERHYSGQSPMSNSCFNRIIRTLVHERVDQDLDVTQVAKRRACEEDPPREVVLSDVSAPVASAPSAQLVMAPVMMPVMPAKVI